MGEGGRREMVKGLANRVTRSDSGRCHGVEQHRSGAVEMVRLFAFLVVQAVATQNRSEFLFPETKMGKTFLCKDVRGSHPAAPFAGIRRGSMESPQRLTEKREGLHVLQWETRQQCRCPSSSTREEAEE